MSENINEIDVSLGMTDLPTFAGKKFIDELCPVCGIHLAVAGHGRCVMCLTVSDVPVEELAYDPELGDVVHGLGDDRIW